MKTEKLINKWRASHIITEEQSHKMLASLKEHKKEHRSSKVITALSVIGSILLGIAAILFIAANWRHMPNALKVVIFTIITYTTYVFGFILAHHKKTLPKAGSAILFLSTLFFGGTIILIAQIYNINANAHELVLLWLIGILPLVYIFRSQPLATLASLLFFTWYGLFLYKSYSDFADTALFVPLLFYIIGITVFAIGGLHYAIRKFVKIAYVYRTVGMFVTLLALFVYTFRYFPGQLAKEEGISFSNSFAINFIIFVLLAAIITAINWIFLNHKKQIFTLEHPINLGLVVLALLMFFVPNAPILYSILFNLVFVGILLAMLYTGYHHEEIKFVNIAIPWLVLFIGVKYFDFMWELMPRSLFFFVGGGILLFGSIVLEKKRRKLNVKFKHDKDQ